MADNYLGVLYFGNNLFSILFDVYLVVVNCISYFDSDAYYDNSIEVHSLLMT